MRANQYYEKTALNGQSTFIPRGKGLGGSSAINFMHAVFPSRSSIDAWEKLGNPAWSFDDLSPYYQRFGTRHAPSPEHRAISRMAGYDDSYSSSGPVQMSFGQGFGPVNSAWMDAHSALGVGPTKHDEMSGAVVGAFQNAACIDPVTKTRSYAASAYYSEEVRKRANLTVLTDTLVTKIELHRQQLPATATGVQIMPKDGAVQFVAARKEVILAAGVVQSPQILELSGIGNATLLEKHNIPVVIDLPGVGENLQDHIQVCQTYKVRDGIPSIDMFRDPQIVQAAIEQYKNNGDGPLGAQTSSTSYLPIIDDQGPLSTASKTALLQGVLPDASGRNDVLREMLSQPDTPAHSLVLFGAQINTDMKDLAHFGSHILPLQDGNHLTVLNALSHPLSRGSCHINSADVSKAPALETGYMTDPTDLEIMARAVMFVDKLMSTDPLASTVVQPTEDRVDTLEKAKAVVKDRTISNCHSCGTCAMLPADKGGVVSDQLIVHGTTNLRVVDASIFPLIPLGNIQTSVYAVAERAADMIQGKV